VTKENLPGSTIVVLQLIDSSEWPTAALAEPENGYITNRAVCAHRCRERGKRSPWLRSFRRHGMLPMLLLTVFAMPVALAVIATIGARAERRLLS
jgi:hypothetical protein